MPRCWFRLIVFALAIGASCLPGANESRAAAPAGENLNVLDFWQIYSDARNALYKEMADEAFAHLEKRANAVAKLQTRADWERYREETRKKLLELAGPFPERTPLNARTLGTVAKDGFRLEKVVYESQPGLYVTAILFVPDPLPAKAPGILYCSGHVPDAFRSAAYQHVILNLVKKGFVVLAFDPINQGERHQFVNPETGKNEITPSGLGHSHAAAPTFILGHSLARLMIWDGIRSLDYLASRPEVDATRLGITGRSGGGTQTAYIAALDDRLVAAAPENYITTFTRLLRSRGPQDAEQNFLNEIGRGLDQADFLIARAPQPTLVLATTRDIFSFEGTLEAIAEAKRGFAALGNASALQMNEDDAEHESTRANREATYAFFQRHLDLPGDAGDLSVPALTPEELRITETGQLATSLGGETILSGNRREAKQRDEALATKRRDLKRHIPAVKKAAARLAGYQPPAGEAKTVFSGRYARDGYSVEKYLLAVDDRYAIPLLALVPNAATPGRVVLYLHPESKAADAAPGGEMERLVRKGFTVVAPDVIGVGELGAGFIEQNDPAHGGFRTWYGYVLLGRSIVGRQVTDVARVAHFVQRRFGVASRDINSVARGAAAPLLLHAAALDVVGGEVTLLEPLVSYVSLLHARRYPLPFLQAGVPAALTEYDLPDLAACLSPRRLVMVNPVAGTGAKAEPDETSAATAVIKAAYSAQGAAEKFVLTRESN